VKFRPSLREHLSYLEGELVVAGRFGASAVVFEFFSMILFFNSDFLSLVPKRCLLRLNSSTDLTLRVSGVSTFVCHFVFTFCNVKDFSIHDIFCRISKAALASVCSLWHIFG
jgi:hypothetical protein